METTSAARRLSGNQIVVMWVALCLALVLAPVGVYAAATQRVKVVGTVKTTVKKAPATTVTGPVTTQLAPLSKIVSGSINASQQGTVGSVFNTSGTVYLTSMTVANQDPAQNEYAYIPTYAAGDTDCSGSQTGVAVMAFVPEEDTVNLVFPTPIPLTHPCAPIVRPADDYVTVILTGFKA